MSDDLQQLQAIINDTKKQVSLAEEGEWEVVVEREAHRDAAIKALFNKPPNIEPDVLAEGIQFILDKNKILSQYSHSQSDSLRMEMGKAGRAHKAINSYLNSSP